MQIDQNQIKAAAKKAAKYYNLGLDGSISLALDSLAAEKALAPTALIRSYVVQCLKAEAASNKIEA